MYEDFTIVGLDNVLDDCQPQPSSADGPTPGRVDAVEPFEKPGQVLPCNADAAVLDLDHDLVFLLPALDVYCVAFFAVFDGIADKVYYGLFKQWRIYPCSQCFRTEYPDFDIQFITFGGTCLYR